MSLADGPGLQHVGGLREKYLCAARFDRGFDFPGARSRTQVRRDLQDQRRFLESRQVHRSIHLHRGQILSFVLLPSRVLEFAYQTADFRYDGGVAEVDWFDHHFYVINAKAGGDDQPALYQFRQIVRKPLVDRFRLKTHWATQKMPVYALVRQQERPEDQTIRGCSRLGKGDHTRSTGNDRRHAQLAAGCNCRSTGGWSI